MRALDWILTALTVLPTAALADDPRHEVSLLVGPTIGVSDASKTQFDVSQSYIFRVTDAFYAGVEAQEGMGNYFRFSLGARAGYSFEVPNLPLTFGPDVRIGLSTVDGEALFNLRLGVQAQYELGNQISLVARPLGVNLSMGSFDTHSIDIMVGAGYAF